MVSRDMKRGGRGKQRVGFVASQHRAEKLPGQRELLRIENQPARIANPETFRENLPSNVVEVDLVLMLDEADADGTIAVKATRFSGRYRQLGFVMQDDFAVRYGRI